MKTVYKFNFFLIIIKIKIDFKTKLLFKNNSMPPKKVYTKKDPIDHVLLRSSMYVGSKTLKTYDDYVAINDEDKDNYKIIKKYINSSPAILRIFIEVLSNAVDNVDRSRKAKIPCTAIKVNINKETGETSVWNDGDIIPIEMHTEEKMYNHTLIFGHMLTGSNYDDTEEREISGLNGLGCKLCNIFSSKFTVKGLDPINKKTFEQTWTNNMKSPSEPIVKATKEKKGYTEVRYFPDFKQFDLEGYTDDIISLYTKYVIDAAMLTGVKVYFNNELIEVNNLVSYSKLYDLPSDESLHIKNPNIEVLITPSEEFQSIAFTNGIFNRLGGQHVDSVSEALFRPLVEKFNKKGKPQLNIKDIKQFFKIFVNCKVVNPEFDSQNKEKLESPKVPFEVKPADIKKLLKWSVISDIEDIIRAKEMVVLKKTEKKKKAHVKIEGYDQANNAGGKLGYQCSLILCEGLSAKNYAVAGIEKGIYGKEGRNWYGIMPLRGKCVSPNTKIITWEGEIKEAKDIKIGDFLINEKGEKTKVLKLYSGEDTMYEIQQNKGINYTVNSMHTLSLKLSGNNNITWSETTNSWNMIYYDISEKKQKTKIIHCKVDYEVEQEKCIETDCIYYNKAFCSRSSLTTHYRRLHNGIKYPPPKKSIIVCNTTITKEEGYIKMCEFRDKIKSPDIIDIDIEDYLNTDDHTKHLLKGFKLETHVDWESKVVYIDPYILGMWLGDGFSNGYGFASEDVELINEWYKWCNNNNCEIVHNNRDDFIIRKKNSIKRGGEDKRIPIGTSETSNKNCRACNIKLNYACSNDEELQILNKNRIIQLIEYDHTKRNAGVNPLKELLDNYKLINNKHIPNDYIFNDKETRLKILAGFIDTDGYIGEDGRIEIVQSIEHKNLIDSLYLISKSLGFYCYISHKTPSYSYKGNKKYSKAIRLSISGNGIQDIPTVLLRKKLNHIFSKNSLHTSIKIVNKGIGSYIGFMTDKTHRFLLEDFTVTHNCLNVRNSIPTTIASNKVITDLIQALNLRHDVDYTDDDNYKTLSYGKVIIMTDSDVDGLHISGLLLNFFHALFPTLLEREEPFIISLQTPIVIVHKPVHKIFYDENKYKEFEKKILEENKKITSKYYKGLGTFEIGDVPDTFGEKIVKYVNDEDTNTLMNKVFHKKFSDQRKEWLEYYNPNPSFSLDDAGKDVDMEISKFLDNEVIKFSHNDCKRSIPSLFDGLKESQRKVLFAVKKRNLTFNKQMLKVAQLGAYTAEHTNYHHGEGNLFDTIIKMAHDFVGSNNIPLLYRGGMFGVRADGGKGAASPRYIFTKMETLTPLLFRSEDDVLLEYVIDDGDQVEPKFYIPIIPTVLINGATGIGSGWSTNIPCYNPLDIIECIKIWLDNEGECLIEDPDDGTVLSLLPEIKPWYRGFTGTIENVKDKFISYGAISKNKNKVEVTELPIGMWTDSFKETCEDWRAEKKIKDFKNYSDHKKIKFTITESDDGLNCTIDNMNLYSHLSISNMVLFNEKDQLKKYSIDEIINDFCKVRLGFYTKRKNYIIGNLEKELKFIGNKARFVKEIIEKKLNIMNVEETILVKELEKRGYDKDFKNSEDEDNESSKNGYEYLLRLQVRTFTANKVKQLNDDIESLKKKLETAKNTPEKQMWLNDLKEFEDEYAKWLKVMENADKPKKTKK
jgi:DNA gyrase/topoisomerase IV subunit B